MAKRGGAAGGEGRAQGRAAGTPLAGPGRAAAPPEAAPAPRRPARASPASAPPASRNCVRSLGSRLHVGARVQEMSRGTDARPPGSVHLRWADVPSHLGSRRITVPPCVSTRHHYFCHSPGHMDRDKNVLHNPGSAAKASAGLGSEAEEAAPAVLMVFGLGPGFPELWALVFGRKSLCL